MTEGGAPRTLLEERKLTPMRRSIAKHLSASWREAVHVTVHRDVDAEALLAAADALQAADEPAGLVDLLLAAVGRTLGEHPAFNATLEDDVHRLFRERNVGYAVAVEGGLLTPVLADLETRDLTGIATERRRLSALVLAGKHTMADLAGGTFTVSNLGPLGVDAFTPILNPPQVGILGVDRVRDVAARGEGGEGVAFRRVLGLDLSIDHRAVDGADAARFLETLQQELGRG